MYKWMVNVDAVNGWTGRLVDDKYIYEQEQTTMDGYIYNG